MILSIAEADRLIPDLSKIWNENVNKGYNLGVLECLSAFSYAVEEDGLDEETGLTSQRIIAKFIDLDPEVAKEWRI